jgi:plastocyanin
MRIRMSLIFMAALLMAACGSYSSPNAPSGMGANAAITGSGFTPNSLNVGVGATVTWTNNDSAAHSVVADGGQFNSGTIAPGAKFSYAFPAAGAFAYHDGSNPKMTGMVNVSGSSSGGY